MSDILFVCVHGNHATADDWKYFATVIRNRFSSAKLLLSTINTDTHCGIMKGGINLASEIDAYVKKLTTKHRLYMVGHSLGGLFARSCLRFISKETYSKLDLCGFMTLCTPHLGSRKPSISIYTKLISIGAYMYFSYLDETGDDLSLASDALMNLSTIKEYTTPLKQFKYRTLVAVTHGDKVVPYVTASIRYNNIYKEPTSTDINVTIVGKFNFDNKYLPNIPNRYELGKSIPTCNNYARDDTCCVEYSKTMCNELNTLIWRRVDIQFNASYCLQYIYGHTIVLNLAPKKIVQFPVHAEISKQSAILVSDIIDIIAMDLDIK